MQQPQPGGGEHSVEYPENGSDADERPLRLPPPPPVPEARRDQPAREPPALEVARDRVTPIFRRTLGVVADAFRFNRRIFSFPVGIAVLWLLFSMMKLQLVSLAQPVCLLPIASRMIPFCPSHISAGRPVLWADYPNLVDLQTRSVDQLLDQSIDNSGLVSEVKKAEMASNDLIAHVRESGMRGKDQIAERLSRFVVDARGTERSLHSLGSKINGAVDT